MAEKWFGFRKEKRLTVHIADGVTFISDYVSANKLGESSLCSLSL